MTERRAKRLPRSRGTEPMQCTASVSHNHVYHDTTHEFIDEGVVISRRRLLKANRAGMDPLRCLRWSEYLIDDKPYCHGHASTIALNLLLRPNSTKHWTTKKAKRS